MYRSLLFLSMVACAMLIGIAPSANQCLAHNATNVQAHIIMCSGRYRIDKHGCEHHECDLE